MAEEKKRSWHDFGFDFEKIEEMMDKLVEGMVSGKEKVENSKPVVMGFQMRIGQNGLPEIKEFGNIKKGRGKPEIFEAREPLADVTESDKEIFVTAELPGVEKKDILLNSKKNGLTISAEGERKFFREIRVKQEVRPKTAKARFKNGILEVCLQKAEPKKRKGNIKIE